MQTSDEIRKGLPLNNVIGRLEVPAIQTALRKDAERGVMRSLHTQKKSIPERNEYGEKTVTGANTYFVYVDQNITHIYTRAEQENEATRTNRQPGKNSI